MKYSIAVPSGASITPAEGEAAKVTEEEADMDPREFLVEVDWSNQDAETPIIVSVDYFACDDHGKWCKPVSQTFEISLVTDRDAGRVQAPGAGGRGGSKGGMKGGKGGPGEGRGMPDAGRMLDRFDANDDGAISKDEASGQMSQRFDQMDSDGDGKLTAEEMKAHFSSRGL